MLQEVVAITGTKASGKGVLVDALLDAGFRMVRYSDCITAELAERLDEREPSTKRLQDYSNQRKREEGDGGYWTGRALERAEQLGITHLVLDGVRNPGEFEALRRTLEPSGVHWHPVVTDADINRRERWFLGRARPGDPVTSEGFRALDARDQGEGEDEYGQQVAKCMAVVPREQWLMNDGTREDWMLRCLEWVAAWTGEHPKED